MAHTTKVNAPAMTANAKLAGAARADTAPRTRAPLELPLAAALPTEAVAEDDPESEGVELPRGNFVPALPGGVAEAGETEEAEPDAADDVLFEVVPLPVPPGRYEGGGTALDGSARAPLPQGIAEPSGCFGFGAGSVAPLEDAMVKRPVQVRSVMLEERENW